MPEGGQDAAYAAPCDAAITGLLELDHDRIALDRIGAAWAEQKSTRRTVVVL